MRGIVRPEGVASTSMSILTATKSAAFLPLQAVLVSGEGRGEGHHHLTTVSSLCFQLVNRSQCPLWPVIPPSKLFMPPFQEDNLSEVLIVFYHTGVFGQLMQSTINTHQLVHYALMC